MNPYDVLDLTQNADEKEIQKAYRKKSLLIHPDKMKDDQQRAEEAFDLLKKSMDSLLDESQRKFVDETVDSARLLALRELGLPITMTAEEIELEQVPGGRLDQLRPSWEDRIKINVKHIILDEELKKRKCVLSLTSRAIQMKQEAEIDAAQRREAAEMERKRRAEMDNAWDESREERVSGTYVHLTAGWRSFQKSVKRKKKATNVLG
ncbi:DnaJ sub C member 8 [Malassezia nana]|uniref:DnaJ sub C member 8 n=1 Tax=Malassezia nana TaxID=180528 RepID=A0AAF0J3V7_9BASI|nr:DnaJ sub C member 8 [Malassezia nana]